MKSFWPNSAGQIDEIIDLSQNKLTFATEVDDVIDLNTDVLRSSTQNAIRSSTQNAIRSSPKTAIRSSPENAIRSSVYKSDCVDELICFPCFPFASTPINSLRAETPITALPPKSPTRSFSGNCSLTTQESSTRKIESVDFNGITQSLEASFLSHSAGKENSESVLNGKFKNNTKQRAAYTSTVRIQKQDKQISLKARNLSEASIQEIAVFRCNCKTYCSMKFHISALTAQRKMFWNFSQKDRKEWMVSDLSRNGTRRIDSTFIFKYFICDQPVR